MTPVASECGSSKFTGGSSTPSAPVLARSYIPNPMAATPTKTSSNPFRILTSERRNSGLPSYHAAASMRTSNDDERPISPTSKYSRTTNCHEKKVWNVFGGGRRTRTSLAPPLPVNTGEMQISAPMGVNPQFAHLVQRPDSALHPSRTGESEPYRWRV